MGVQTDVCVWLSMRMVEGRSVGCLVGCGYTGRQDSRCAGVLGMQMYMRMCGSKGGLVHMWHVGGQWETLSTLSKWTPSQRASMSTSGQALYQEFLKDYAASAILALERCLVRVKL
ncbi:unnamed protein product [Citrullus colocynthis]|uniref:Uncharacterized protein n=1 Tax=Citrullus colocynthis TaxID=252529 RepID=A0ABP0XUR3_9ROSI